MEPPQQLRRLIRKPEVRATTGLSDSEISRLIRAGKFPAPVPLGDGGRAVAFVADEIQAFVASRIALREQASTGRAALGKRLAEARAEARKRQKAA